MEINQYLAKPDQTIGEHAANLIRVLDLLLQYGYIEDGPIYQLSKTACRDHDNGKATAPFQSRVTSRKKIRFDKEKEVPHNVLSGFLLDKDQFDSYDDYIRVLFAILYHHNYGDPCEIAHDEKALIKTLLDGFPVSKLTTRRLNDVKDMMSDDDAIRIKGYLHKCDYSASGGYVAEYPNDFLEDSLENVKKKWQAMNPHSDWNPLQKFCQSKRDENIIVVAQTGMGKTEAGLQWIGNRKGYFVLPLRTAINAIYDRVRKDVLLNKDIETRLSILHSESLEYYSDHLDDQEMELLEYENRGKRFSIPLNISTMDQLFDFVFLYPGYELKLTTLSYSRIVIDEIQMYDPQMLAYLIYGLKRITQLGGKVAVMTATLSPFIKELLIREIPFKEENIKTFTNDMIRHNIKVKDSKIDPNEIFDFYSRNKKENKANKILVVCNSIRKAQELYGELKEKMKDSQDELHILHSRFIKKERAEKEKEILDFGKTYDRNGSLDIQSGIWISTSLVEASLDIDFDYLFTELQDLNSLFQRLGRCNRKGVKDLLEPNCFIYLEIDKKLLISNGGFVDDTVYSLSRQAMAKVDGPLSELQKLDLLNETLTIENLKESEYYNGKNGYKQKMQDIRDFVYYSCEKNEVKLRNILSKDIIPNQVYASNKNEIDAAAAVLNRHADLLEQIRAKEAIMKHSVSIPYWHWLSYCKAVSKNTAKTYPAIPLGRYGKIPVMECEYDELGYSKKNYSEAEAGAVFL